MWLVTSLLYATFSRARPRLWSLTNNSWESEFPETRFLKAAVRANASGGIQSLSFLPSLIFPASKFSAIGLAFCSYRWSRGLLVSYYVCVQVTENRNFIECFFWLTKSIVQSAIESLRRACASGSKVSLKLTTHTQRPSSIIGKSHAHQEHSTMGNEIIIALLSTESTQKAFLTRNMPPVSAQSVFPWSY